MKRKDVIIREFSLKKKKILTSGDLKAICDKYDFDFGRTKVSLMNKGYLLTIFRGIYYLRDFNEKKTGVIKYSADELLSEGLRLKGAGNWYFGLNTAFKMMNLTHEIFAVDYVLNDRFNRVKPMKILGSNFLFVKIKPSLFSFGIEKTTTANDISISYSNAEKTLLDMVYLYRLSGKSREAIISLIGEYAGDVDKKKLINYAKNYPKTIRKIIAEALGWTKKS